MVDASVTAACEELIGPRQSGGAFLLGISGPQGSGKSTLAARLVERLRAAGKAALAVSIDDFYLTRTDQVALAEAHPANRLLEHRGFAGTHDVELGRRVLEGLRAQRPTRVPRYDKSAHGGRGDRLPLDAWEVIAQPLDVVILEGWMLGMEPRSAEAIPLALRTSNALLAQYARWLELVDALVVLEASRLDDIVAWRVDAERARRSRGESALTDEEARDYIERFLPVYEAYTPIGKASVRLRVTLAADRSAAALHR